MHIVRILWLYDDGLKLDIVWVNRFNPNILWEDRVFVKRKDVAKWKELPCAV